MMVPKATCHVQGQLPGLPSIKKSWSRSSKNLNEIISNSRNEPCHPSMSSKVDSVSFTVWAILFEWFFQSAAIE